MDAHFIHTFKPYNSWIDNFLDRVSGFEILLMQLGLSWFLK